MTPIIAKDNQKEYTPAPEGLHQAVCVDVEDLGPVETQWGYKPMVKVRWQLDQTYLDEESQEQKRYVATARYNLTLNEKSNLRKHLEAWRGKKFTAEELKGFDLEKLIGVNCQLQIIHHIADGGRTFANVQAIVPLGKGMTKIHPENYVRMKDRANKDEQLDPEPAEDDLPF